MSAGETLPAEERAGLTGRSPLYHQSFPPRLDARKRPEPTRGGPPSRTLRPRRRNPATPAPKAFSAPMRRHAGRPTRPPLQRRAAADRARTCGPDRSAPRPGQPLTLLSCRNIPGKPRSIEGSPPCAPEPTNTRRPLVGQRDRTRPPVRVRPRAPEQPTRRHQPRDLAFLTGDDGRQLVRGPPRPLPDARPLLQPSRGVRPSSDPAWTSPRHHGERSEETARPKAELKGCDHFGADVTERKQMLDRIAEIYHRHGFSVETPSRRSRWGNSCPTWPPQCRRCLARVRGQQGAGDWLALRYDLTAPFGAASRRSSATTCPAPIAAMRWGRSGAKSRVRAGSASSINAMPIRWAAPRWRRMRRFDAMLAALEHAGIQRGDYLIRQQPQGPEWHP